MNRRMFFRNLGGGVSSSFLVGTAGGVVAGAVGTTAVLSRGSHSNRSYSQQGEDLIIESLCVYLKITNPIYLDIGAADPIVGNNTYLFYLKGARGVLVEPNPTLCRSLRDTRPRDTVLNIGVGFKDEDVADYYMISGSGGETLNTFSKDQVDRIITDSKGERHVEKILKMPLVNINKIMEEHFRDAPSIVSIDTEGLDLEILKSLDFERYRPPILCAETLVLNSTKMESRILDLMQSKNYSVRGGTFVNTCFVDNQLL
jgi:FkbM family methyltransferase